MRVLRERFFKMAEGDWPRGIRNSEWENLAFEQKMKIKKIRSGHRTLSHSHAFYYTRYKLILKLYKIIQFILKVSNFVGRVLPE